MKKVQRTDVKQEYVKRVFTADTTSQRTMPAGKQAMMLALQTVVKLAKDEPFFHTLSAENTDILNTNEARSNKPSFNKELYEFVVNNQNIIKPGTLVNPTPRTCT